MTSRMDRHKKKSKKEILRVPEKKQKTSRVEKQEESKEETKISSTTTSTTQEVGSKKKKKKKKYWLWIIVVLLLVLLGKFLWDTTRMMNGIQDQKNPNDEISLKVANEKVKKREPIAILLLGTDDGALNRSNNGGLTDTMMVLAMNPKENKSLMMSLERDSYVDITNGGGKAKLNSAYRYGGAANSVATVEQLLGIPIEYYATINMKGLEDLVDAVGGVTVDSNLAFTFDGYTFQKGPNKIETGAEALAFTRMRKEDPDGDYGRQKRQRALVTAIIKKLGSASSLLHYKSILDTVEHNMKTDMPMSVMVKMATTYRSSFDHMETDYLHGNNFMLDGVSYEDISGDLPRVKQALQSILGMNAQEGGMDNEQNG